MNQKNDEHFQQMFARAIQLGLLPELLIAIAIQVRGSIAVLPKLNGLDWQDKEARLAVARMRWQSLATEEASDMERYSDLYLAIQAYRSYMQRFVTDTQEARLWAEEQDLSSRGLENLHAFLTKMIPVVQNMGFAIQLENITQPRPFDYLGLLNLLVEFYPEKVLIRAKRGDFWSKIDQQIFPDRMSSLKLLVEELPLFVYAACTVVHPENDEVHFVTMGAVLTQDLPAMLRLFPPTLDSGGHSFPVVYKARGRDFIAVVRLSVEAAAALKTRPEFLSPAIQKLHIVIEEPIRLSFSYPVQSSWNPFYQVMIGDFKKHRLIEACPPPNQVMIKGVLYPLIPTKQEHVFLGKVIVPAEVILEMKPQDVPQIVDTIIQIQALEYPVSATFHGEASPKTILLGLKAALLQQPEAIQKAQQHYSKVQEILGAVDSLRWTKSNETMKAVAVLPINALEGLNIEAFNQCQPFRMTIKVAENQTVSFSLQFPVVEDQLNKFRLWVQWIKQSTFATHWVVYPGSKFIKPEPRLDERGRIVYPHLKLYGLARFTYVKNKLRLTFRLKWTQNESLSERTWLQALSDFEHAQKVLAFENE